MNALPSQPQKHNSVRGDNVPWKILSALLIQMRDEQEGTGRVGKVVGGWNPAEESTAWGLFWFVGICPCVRGFMQTPDVSV